jgi:Holliday junction resolvase RusA-like endonuclease
MTTLQHAWRVALRIYGEPIPQGSKRIARRGKGKTQRTFLLDNNEALLHPWRAHVKAQAEDQARYADSLAGPLRVWIRFTFTRPPSHYRSGRNSHLLKAGAAAFPGHGCGDIDKLVRAIFDAFTDAGVWSDDTQVVDVRARKFYVDEDQHALDRSGVDVVIEPLTTVPVSGDEAVETGTVPPTQGTPL